MNNEFWIKFFEHLNLSLFSFSISILVTAIIIIISIYNKVFKNILLSLVSFIQTIPSIAIFGLLLPFIGIGSNLALVAIVAYSIFPIVSSILSAINNIDDEYETIIQSLGLSKIKALYEVRIPLVFTSILSGIKLSLVYAISTTTLASFVGAGGLGDYIFQGISANNVQLTLKGSIPIALLAVLFSVLFDLISQSYSKHKIKSKTFFNFILIPVMVLMFAINVVILPIVTSISKNEITVGYKNFPEQKLLANITKQLIQRHSNITVNTKALGDTGTNIENGLETKSIDGAIEYTGTAYLSVFNYKLPKNYKSINLEKEMIYKINNKYNEKNIKMFDKIGFENNYSIVVKNSHQDLKTISDLKDKQNDFIFGMTNEFYTKDDGYKLFKKEYNFNFKENKTFDPSIMYQGLKNNKIQVGLAYSTSPEIKTYNLKMLKDDKKFFPTYSAYPIFLKQTLKEHPKLNNIINKMKGIITTSEMQQLNNEYVKNPSNINHIINNYLNRKGL